MKIVIKMSSFYYSFCSSQSSIFYQNLKTDILMCELLFLAMIIFTRTVKMFPSSYSGGISMLFVNRSKPLCEKKAQNSIFL